MEILNQIIPLSSTTIQLAIKREDMIHPFVSGNKYRKLKYNLLEAKAENKTTLLTFGGAYSNHIAAVAFAGIENNFKTIGIIRGEELKDKIESNPTLRFAKNHGMQLEFITREAFKKKTEKQFIDELHSKYGDFYLIPEGGTNALAIQGCEEILTLNDQQYDYICCCVGTAGTICGLINSASKNQKILGFSALKGIDFEEEILKFAKKNTNWELLYQYHFDGYAKVTPELINFINDFKSKYCIPLDPIYTGKLLFGVIDLIKKNYFPENSKILVIHTGGLQGIDGMNAYLEKKKWPLLHLYE